MNFETPIQPSLLRLDFREPPDKKVDCPTGKGETKAAIDGASSGVNQAIGGFLLPIEIRKATILSDEEESKTDPATFPRRGFR